MPEDFFPEPLEPTTATSSPSLTATDRPEITGKPALSAGFPFILEKGNGKLFYFQYFFLICTTHIFSYAAVSYRTVPPAILYLWTLPGSRSWRRAVPPFFKQHDLRTSIIPGNTPIDDLKLQFECFVKEVFTGPVFQIAMCENFDAALNGYVPVSSFTGKTETGKWMQCSVSLSSVVADATYQDF